MTTNLLETGQTRTVNRQGVRSRDNQRSKLYKAERVLHTPPQFETVQQCQDFVNEVMASRWVAARWKNRIEVRPGYGHRSATADPTSQIIQLPVWARHHAVILHEMAHCLNTGSRAYAWHGPEFAGLFLSLVHHVMGADAATKLRESFKANRVRYNLKAIPSSPRFEVVPKTVIAAKARQRATRPLTLEERHNLAALLRRAAKAGQLGPADRKPRIHALSTARLVEGIS